MSDIRVAVLVGSLRADSLNRKLAEILRDQAPAGVILDLIDGLGELPFYNEDLDGESVPASVQALRDAVGSADRVLAVTPEYNGTMPAVLNNALDWLSRPYGAGAIFGKPFGVVGATPTPYGGKWAHADAARRPARRSPRGRGRDRVAVRHRGRGDYGDVLARLHGAVATLVEFQPEPAAA